MARLGRSYVLPIIVRGPAAATTPGTSESGTAAVGGSTTAVAVRVASVVAVCAVGAAAAGTAVHVAPRAGTCPAGSGPTAAAAKHAPQAGTSPAGTSTSGAAARHAPQAGAATAGVGSAAHDTEVARPAGPATAGVGGWVVAVTKTAAVTARAAAGAATTGGAAKHAPQTGAATAGGATSVRAVRVAPQASTGTVGASPAAGRPAQTAVQSGTASAAAGPSGSAAKTAPAAGLAAAGLAASAPIPGAHPQTGIASVGGSTRSAVTKVAGPASVAAAGAAARAAAARVAVVAAVCAAGGTGSGTAGGRRAPSGVAAAGAASRVVVSRSVSPSGVACAGVAGGAGAGGRRGQSGTSVAGAAGGAAAARRVAAAGWLAAGAGSSGVAGQPAAAGPALYRVAAALLGCADDALDVAGRPVQRACVMPGQVAWDGCDCGLLTVTVTRVYPSQAFPVDASGAVDWASCPPPYMAADLSVTVLRCAPQPAGTDLAPSCAALHGAAAGWRADAATIRTAAGCCLTGLEDDGTIGAWTLGDAVPVGPEGGCVGVEQHVTVALCPPAPAGSGGGGDVVAGIVAGVEAALASTPAGPVGRSCDVPGLLAWDGCDCGLLGVTVNRIYPSAVFPAEAVGQVLTSPCRPAWDAMDITVTVLRCAPGLDNAGRPPSCAVLGGAAEQWAFDVDAVRGALSGCLTGLEDAGTIGGWTLRSSDPAGPQGGCVGSDTHLTVAVPACGCAGV